ncbi:MAG: sporulation protein [Candidatus Onthomonas sp.]
MARIGMGLMLGLYALALICCPQAGAEAARTGLALCGEVILPALFPYFVLSNLAIGLGLGQWLGRRLGRLMPRLFHVGGAGGAALALGLLGGYPVGAGAVRELLDRGQCSQTEAQKLLCFCNNAGPAFILSVAGVSIFGRIEIGFLLLLVHALSALGVGLLLRGPVSGTRALAPSPASRPATGVLLPQAVGKALSSSLQVCAYVVLFNVLIGLLRALTEDWLSLSGVLACLLAGLLELSNGVCALPAVSSPTLRLALCGFLLGWGGLSVHSQTAALLEGSGLKLGPYLRAKALQGLLSAGLLALAGPLCRGMLPVSQTGGQLTLVQLFPQSLAFGAVLWIVILVLLTNRGGKSPAGQV